VNILCSSCRAENWLENQSRCISCEAILRRCIDCNGYEPRRRLCRKLKVEVEPNEARSPSLLSGSTSCRDYHPTVARSP
jgi:hypothetical protein